MSKFSPLGFCQRATGMSKPDSNIDRWELHHCIEVAGHLNLLKPDTSSAARLARSFKPDLSRPRSAPSHPCLPATVLALGLGRRQRKDMNAGITEGSEFAAIAGRDRIVKLAGPAFLVTAGPAQDAHQISKEGTASNLPQAAKSLGTGIQTPRICL
jgi:hypothetical protein